MIDIITNYIKTKLYCILYVWGVRCMLQNVRNFCALVIFKTEHIFLFQTRKQFTSHKTVTKLSLDAFICIYWFVIFMLEKFIATVTYGTIFILVISTDLLCDKLLSNISQIKFCHSHSRVHVSSSKKHILKKFSIASL